MKTTKPSFSISNRKAGFDYIFIKKFDVGIVLVGSEIKSIRNSECSIRDAYCYISEGELFIRGMKIEKFKQAGINNHDIGRDRKLLLNKSEITTIEKMLIDKGLTVVPIKLFQKNNKAKLEIAVARGKKKFDKREAIKKRDVERETKRNDS